MIIFEGWERLCPFVLGVRSLHSSEDGKATYEEVVELSSRKKLSSLTTKNFLFLV